MSSLPFISHHLFVAAVDHERRHEVKPPRNPADQESSAPPATVVELSAGQFNFDRGAELISGSPLASET